MKIFKKATSLMLMVLITMQSMQITIFANNAEIIDILNGNNYDDFIVTDEPDDTVIYSSQNYEDNSSSVSDNTPAFAHLLDAQEPSDPVIRIMNLLDIDEAAAMQMITVFGGAESALEEAELYNSLKNIYYTLNYDSVKDYLTSLVVNGYGAQRVTMSYIVADALGEDILDVMIDEYPEEEIDDEYIAILVYDYYVSPEFIYNYLEENDTTSEIMYTVIFSTFKILYPETLPSTFADEEDETAEYPTAPFYAQNGESEYISPSSGQLLYQMDLATVTGINGMDINLSLKYNSGTSAVLGEMKTETTTVGQPIFDSNGNYISGVANVTLHTYYDDYNWSEKSPFIFGSGWRLDFDYIKTVDEDKFLVLTDGSEYKINLLSSGNKLLGYNRDALTFTEDTTYNNSKYKLVFSDGTIEYFNEKGDLLAIIDRFGNGITFTHSKVTSTEQIGNSTVVYTDRLVISNTITSIIIDYSLTDYRITLPKNEQQDEGPVIRLTLAYTDEGYQLTSVKNQAGEVTTFDYELMQGGRRDYADPKNTEQLYIKAGYTFERPYHHLLSEITHPTGAKVEYTYESRQTAAITQACVTSRKDVIGTNISNSVSYSYNEDSLSINKADYGNRVVEYVCDGDGFVVKETTKVGDSIKSWIIRNYALCGKPSRVEYSQPSPNYGALIGYMPYDDGHGNSGMYPVYDTSCISNVSTYTYDSKGYVLTSTENGLTKSYTYDSTYHLPFMVVYNKDDNTQVREVNILSSDKKCVLEHVVYVNNVLSAKRGYTYDARGNVTNEKAYKDSSNYVETTYIYDAAGRLTSQTTAGVSLSYTYDAMGRVLSETDGNGNTTSYIYDAVGRVIEVIHPDNTESNRSHITTSYTVSNIENSIIEIDEVGNITKYNYDALGNIVSVYVGNTLVERYEYDEYSRVSRKFDSQDNYTIYAYDHAGRTTAVNVFASGSAVADYQETYAYEAIAADNLLKTTKTVVGELNAPSIVTLTYTDVYGRVVKEGYKVGANERLTTYTYDNCGNKTSELSALDAQNGYAFTNQYVYDFNNRVVRQINALGESAYTEYDWLGNALRKIDNNNNVTTLTYDAFGRVLTQTTPFDTTTSTKIVYTYDNLGNVTEEKILSVSSDNTETLLRKTIYGYDVRGNLLCVMSYHSTNEEGEEEYLATAVYTYDKKGQMLTSTAGNYTTQYAYDAYGNVSRITYPGGGYETFTYLPNGNLLSSTDRSGVTTTYTYNALGNPITATAGTGENARTISYTYAKTGAVLSESNSTATTSYTYDAMGRVATEGAASYTYDLNGNITSVTIGGRVVSYTYDRLNRMVSATEGNITAAYNYNNLGHRTSTVISVGGTTAAQTTYTYNLAGLATTLVNKNGAGETLSSFAYTYAADGNILTEVDHTGATTTYTYDLLGRLICENGKYYEYDDAGNRKKVIIDTTTTIDYTYINGELISETSNNGTTSETTLYEYDANGNLTKKTKGASVTNYTYDVWGNMVSADNATYTYNAQGLRVSKTVGNNTDVFTLVGGNVWSDGTTNYTRGIELISNGTQLYLYNVRGDVIQLLGFDGDVDKTYDYDAYGNELQRNSNDSNPFRYCGEYYDTETGFIYLRARYYDPATGRFVAMDTHWNTDNAIYGDTPVKTSSADDCTSLYPNINAIIQSTNLYVYCGNNPVSLIDLDGESFLLAMGIGLLAGVIGQYVSDVVENVSSGKQGTDIFTPTSSVIDYVASGLGGAIAAIPGLNLLGTMAVGAAGNVVSEGLKGNINSWTDFGESALIGAFANGVGYGLSKAMSSLKVNQISNLSRNQRKSVLQSLYGNSNKFVNENLRTFANDTMINNIKLIENGYLVFRSGAYSTITSTVYTVLDGAIR